MPTWRERVEICDPWSYYDYKNSFWGRAQGKRPTWEAPDWCGEHRRRIAAYHLLDDYVKNRGAAWMDPEVDEEDRKDHREYGDPSVIVASIRSSIVGDRQRVVVEDIQEELDIGGPRTDLQDVMDEWLLQERFIQKMMHNEKTAVHLGDAVYTLGWDQENERTRVRVWDPGFYFPVLDDWSHDDDYPRRVHIAWEYERPDDNQKRRTYLRRITWWLEEGAAQSLPWNAKPTVMHCYMDEKEWLLDDVKNEVEYLSDDYSIPITDAVDLGVDFLPVVHIPNTISETEHFGDSSLASVMQIVDDLSSTDTDLQAASATTGAPPISIEEGTIPRGEDGEIVTYGPGQVFTGKLTMLDTSRSLDALLKLKEALENRLSQNSRVPKTLLGSVDPGQVNSGIILTLTFTPHSAMVREMRLVRADKYDLLLKFVIRFYMLAGRLTAYYPTHLEFGSYLPSDRQEISHIVGDGIRYHSMSIETGVALMMQAGYPIEDAQLEVARIISQNFDAANKALDASGDIDFARGLLGLPPLPQDALLGNAPQELNPTQTPPAPALPAAGGQ